MAMPMATLMALATAIPTLMAIAMLMQMGIMPPGMGAPGGGVSIGPPPGMGDPTAGGGVWTPGSAEADAPSAADDASGDSDDGGSKLWIPD